MHRDLIFDIGTHTGGDSFYYLAKGFRVVGLEAREDLSSRVVKGVAERGWDARFTLVQKALFERAGENVSFYINDEKDDWGSLYRGAAEQGRYVAREISVPTTTLAELLSQFGTPYYIKCDIEGGDSIFAEQLLQSRERPAFVSIEATQPDDVAKLRACGYSRFQIVNQMANPSTEQPNPAREGVYVPSLRFTQAMSGLFGRDLPEDKWIDFRTVMRRLLDWRELRNADAQLAPGWLDVHATL